MQDAVADRDSAFRQLEFSIKLLSYCELGHINPADLHQRGWRERAEDRTMDMGLVDEFIR